MTVLVLEDEEYLQESIKEELHEMGLKVDTTHNGNQALALLSTRKYNLFFLDINVQGMSGLELVEQIRAINQTTPIIMMTSNTSIDYLAKGYELGCNDFIKKPFEILELRHRVAYALKAFITHSATKTIELPFGYLYDTTTFSLFIEGKEVQLTKTEKNILELLIKNMGKIISVESFQHEIWDHSMDAANVRVQINNLRKKLHQEMIVNIRGLGYKLGS
jgi:DNA-binding response OmpR family regulator